MPAIDLMGSTIELSFYLSQRSHVETVNAMPLFRLCKKKMCCNAISSKTLLALLINVINDRKLKNGKF